MPYWQKLGQELLEREVRPTVALTSAGKLIAVNRAMRSMLRLRGELSNTSISEWLSEDDHVALLRAIDTVTNCQHTRVVLRPLRAPGIHCVFDVSLASDEPESVVLMVMIDALPHSAHVPLMPVAGLTYEVMVDRHGRPGKLLRLVGSGHQETDCAGSTCFEALHDRKTPCERCPVMGELPSPVRVVSVTPFAAEIVRTERGRSNTVTVTTVPIDEPLYRSMVQARVDALERRAHLTERERRVLDQLLLGRSIEEVADAERISPRTAKYHQQNLLRKLGAESRLDLLRLLT